MGCEKQSVVVKKVVRKDGRGLHGPGTSTQGFGVQEEERKTAPSDNL